jgi:predicted PurR-regulated permease PerM
MHSEHSPVMGSVSQTPQEAIDRAVPDSSPATTPAPPDGGEASEAVSRFDLTTFLLLVICVVLAIYTLYFGRAVIIPLMVALLLKLVLSPVVSALSSLRLPEWAGAALVLTGVVAAVGYGIFALSSPAAEWVGKLPESVSNLEMHLKALKEPVAQMQKAEETISKLSDIGPRRSETVVVSPSGLGATILSETTNLAVELSATLVLLYFLLSSGDFFLRKLVTVLPRFGDKKQAVEIAQQVQSDISHYLFTITVINIALGVVVAGALYALGMPSPALWGTMAAILNFIPFLGHVVGFSVIGLVALMSFGDLEAALIPPAVYACVAFMEGQFITPAIVARRLTLNPVAVFVALIFWGWLWMIPGMLLAVPMLAVFKIFCDHIRPLKPIGEFLGH